MDLLEVPAIEAVHVARKNVPIHRVPNLTGGEPADNVAIGERALRLRENVGEPALVRHSRRARSRAAIEWHVLTIPWRP